ncbi:WD40 repeat domain-containing protein [Calothrix sp. FACHB-1219]|uniref:WD40 repeat domain-containing protein n=1 Tax=unclassified Calothrix TaxID=2619626 RepID=UPI001682422D|nr:MULTISPECIES: WD40 repeat domain-containing protein [unclassified Calothrix]MBD2202320.1 WD40 repeat domain-containing protein [Calothrix sp. FACHB-168]MBD2217726.1 WD40 repeat domain-containing protein [Calothrix sp. FACHB-1219]
MYNLKAALVKPNLIASMILVGVQLLLWKGVSTISYTPSKDSPILEAVKVSHRLQTTLKGHALKVTSVAITTDNNHVITGSEDNTIKIWNAKTGELKRTLTGHTGVVNYLSVTPDGKYIVSGDDKNVKIWNLLTGELIRDLRNPDNKINFIETSQDGQTLVMDGGTQIIKNTAVNPANYIYSSEPQQITKYIIGVFNLQTGTVKSQLVHNNLVTEFKISPSSHILVSGDVKGNLNIWNFQTGTLEKTLTGHESEIQYIAISPDEKTLVSTDKDGKIKIWDLVSGKLKSTFTGHDWQFYLVKVFIADNNTLISWNTGSSSLRKTDVKIWNLQTGEFKYSLNPVKQDNSYLSNNFDFVKVSPNRKNLITKLNKSIQVWELATGKLQDTIDIQGSILAFSPDAKMLAAPVEYEDNTINIWQIPAHN